MVVGVVSDVVSAVIALLARDLDELRWLVAEVELRCSDFDEVL